MKKQIDLQLLTAIGGGILFNFFFWMEWPALNLLLYSIFILIILLLDKGIVKSRKFFWFGAAHLLAGALVVINNSALSIVSWYISLALFVGFTHYQLLRGVFTALLAFFLQMVTAPFNLIKRALNARFGNFSLKPILKPIKYIIIPIIALTLFSILYRIANPVFDGYLSEISSQIANFFDAIFSFLFADLSLTRFVHIIFGIIVTAAILIKHQNNSLEKVELGFNEQLIRSRKKKSSFHVVYDIVAIFAGNLLARKTALKTENVIGIISFTALNLLLLFLNCIDIVKLWLPQPAGTTLINYSEELHGGTNALIISIIMAMLVILYFFNGNLNFYSKNKIIRLLAYIWIIQNAFLVLSVLLRDYYYIDMSGLTYKRIGVLVFLLLCTIGLITVYIKVAQQKTFFYLCKTNGMIWYILLLATSFVNWDIFIASYNINHRDRIALDVEHLMELSDKTLPLLDENRAILEKYAYSSATELSETIVEPKPTDSIKIDTAQTPFDKNKFILERQRRQIEKFNKLIDRRIDRFNEKWGEGSWLSWNYNDWHTHLYLKARNKTDHNP
jgi:hypothetical protein